MTKEQFIKMVLDNPAPACSHVGGLKCRNNGDSGRLEPGYPEGWKYISDHGSSSFYVTDEFLEEVIWNNRRKLWHLYKPVPTVKSTQYKEFALEQVMGNTEEDQKKIEGNFSFGLLVARYEGNPNLARITDYNRKTIAHARFIDGVNWNDIPYTWSECDENGEPLPWGKGFKGSKEDFIKHLESKL